MLHFLSQPTTLELSDLVRSVNVLFTVQTSIRVQLPSWTLFTMQSLKCCRHGQGGPAPSGQPGPISLPIEPFALVAPPTAAVDTRSRRNRCPPVQFIQDEADDGEHFDIHAHSEVLEEELDSGTPESNPPCAAIAPVAAPTFANRSSSELTATNPQATNGST